MSTAKPAVKRTYGSQLRRTYSTASSSETSQSQSSSPSREITTTTTLAKRRRPLLDAFTNCGPPAKKPALKKATQSSAKKLVPKKRDTLSQLHFITEEPTLRTCSLCDLSYTRGAPDDEALHKSHCSRVQKGMEWRKEDEKEMSSGNGVAVLISEDVGIGSGERGRIVAVKPTGSSKLAAKVTEYLKTVNLALSAPDSSPSSLRTAKAYLFLLREKNSSREKIVGCVLAQRISSAMRIATKDEVLLARQLDKPLIHVEGDLYCTPERHATPMGIPRLFVSSGHRRKGIARTLLSAAARTFIHGCDLNPARGEIAFSQPTSMGRAVMEKWGRGGVRVYEE